MNRIEIYKEDELKLSILVSKYDVCTYTNGFEITCTVDDVETTYKIPLHKGYEVRITI